MANHFTPEELARELGMDTKEVIQFCVDEGIPIYKGKIDRSLLTVVMKAKGLASGRTQRGGALARTSMRVGGRRKAADL